jgi:Domain of unknown function (DUF4148)
MRAGPSKTAAAAISIDSNCPVNTDFKKLIANRLEYSRLDSGISIIGNDGIDVESPGFPIPKSFSLIKGIIMNKYSVLIAGVFALGAVTAHAADFDVPGQVTSTSTKTRAEVKAETLRAIKAGEVSVGDVGYPPAVSASSSLSRAEVKAETRRAIAAGEVTFGDADLPVVAKNTAGGKTRAEVKEEVRVAIANHELSFGDVGYPDRGIVTIPRAKKPQAAAAAASMATNTAD